MISGIVSYLKKRIAGSRIYRNLTGSVVLKFLSSIIICNILLVVIFVLILSSIIISDVNEDIYAGIEADQQRVSQQIDGYVDNMRYILSTMFISKDVKKVVIDTSDKPFEEYLGYKNTFNLMDTLIYSREFIDIYLITLNKQKIYSTDDRITSAFLKDYDMDSLGWFGQMKDSPGNYVFLSDFGIPGYLDEEQIAYTARLSYINDVDGFVIVTSKKDILEDIIIDNMTDEVPGAVLLDKEGLPVAYHASKDLSADDMVLWATGRGPVAGDYVVITDTSENTELKIVYFVSKKAVNSRSLVYKLSLVGLSIAVFVFIALLNFLLMKKVVGAIKTVLSYAHTAQGGGLGKLLDRKDEIGDLSKTVDSMIIKNMESEILIKDAQIKMLQQQINPHFLYNVLEAISSLALVSGQVRIADIISKLGKVFRYNLCSTENENFKVTFEEELDNFNNYRALYKLRYTNKLKITENVDPDINKYQTMKFLLQPIVENSIKHGMKKGKHVLAIDISGHIQGDMIVFTIVDNGKGMGPDEVKKINDRINGNADADQKYGVGLYNVNQRIKLIFGDGYGLEISSIKDKKTEVEVRLPVIGP